MLINAEKFSDIIVSNAKTSIIFKNKAQLKNLHENAFTKMKITKSVHFDPQNFCINRHVKMYLRSQFPLRKMQFCRDEMPLTL